ncbi:hypothetical protein [Kitasatospora viridis]|uniref:Uncharacterized protein n=1 Tax=Kitasatospora viridis TaxID=281105 RepID=A0A561UD63_9ACTN|nr:hypothetical protein [Kitasatospora viridis]TWF97310.1 hypothetical protein FHX73_111090 [Kitasatospora viridis]
MQWVGGGSGAGLAVFNVCLGGFFLALGSMMVTGREGRGNRTDRAIGLIGLVFGVLMLAYGVLCLADGHTDLLARDPATMRGPIRFALPVVALGWLARFWRRHRRRRPALGAAVTTGTLGFAVAAPLSYAAPAYLSLTAAVACAYAARELTRRQAIRQTD